MTVKSTVIDLSGIKEDVIIEQGTLYLTDSVLNTRVAVTISNGVFFVDGIAQAQLPNVKVTNLTFNNNTVQTTAFIPGVGQFNFRSTPPLHDHGAVGDKAYDACLDGTHLYICKRNYVDDATVIWGRIAYSSGNW